MWMLKNAAWPYVLIVAKDWATFSWMLYIWKTLISTGKSGINLIQDID